MLHEWLRLRGKGAGAKQCTTCDYIYIPGKVVGLIPDCPGRQHVTVELCRLCNRPADACYCDDQWER